MRLDGGIGSVAVNAKDLQQHGRRFQGILIKN